MFAYASKHLLFLLSSWCGQVCSVLQHTREPAGLIPNLVDMGKNAVCILQTKCVHEVLQCLVLVKPVAFK